MYLEIKTSILQYKFIIMAINFLLFQILNSGPYEIFDQALQNEILCF